MPTLDLHGFKTDEVFDALDRFLRKAEAQGEEKIRIIHGKGTGKVKTKVLEYLKITNYPAKPELIGKGRVNEGALIVFI